MIAVHSAEIRIRRRDGAPECDVIVIFRGQEMSLRCRDYDQAVKWARIECNGVQGRGRVHRRTLIAALNDSLSPQ